MLRSAWKSLFTKRPGKHLHGRRRLADRFRLEALEVRVLPAVTLAPISPVDMASGKDQVIALDGFDDFNNAISYTVDSTNAGVQASVVTGGRSLRLTVSGVDSSNLPFVGNLTFRLFEEANPKTTARIISLVENNFYDNLSFHRVLNGFVAQGGDPAGNGTGGTNINFDDEYSTKLTFTSRGLLAMANSGDDSNDTQFFITDTDVPLGNMPQHLNFQHNIFGVLTNGFDTFTKLINTPVGNPQVGNPVVKPIIQDALVFTDNENGVLRLSTASNFTGTSQITVTANNGVGGTTSRTFNINVAADTINDRPFLGDIGNIVTTEDTPVSVDVQGIDLEKDTLSFVVRDPASFATASSVGVAPSNVDISINVTAAIGDTPSVARITFTPHAGFSGVIDMLVGVRDQTLRNPDNSANVTINSRTQFDTQKVRLTVQNVNDRPTAGAQTLSTEKNTAISGTLTGDDGDANENQTLTFSIVTPPTQGTITNFNPATGDFTFTPNPDFVGAATFQFQVQDDGGGDDTSPPTTVTIGVGLTPPSAPDLSASTDNGLFNDDNYITTATASVSVTAVEGALVQFRVNGNLVTATEETPGTYRATLTDDHLKVGGNDITATMTINGGTSELSAVTSITYAPDYSRVYTVPGTVGVASPLTFVFTARNAAFNNEIGYFVVDDFDGTVGGLKPADAAYIQAALGSSTRTVVFASGSGTGAVTQPTPLGGQLLVFYLVSDGTAAQASAGSKHVFFSTPKGNRDGVEHVRITADPTTGTATMRWEDMFGGGDRDYNDAFINVTPGTSTLARNTAFVPAYFVPAGAGRNVETTFTLRPTERGFDLKDVPPALLGGELGLFFVDTANGAIGNLNPGDAGWLAQALAANNRVTIFSAGAVVGQSRDLDLAGGRRFGVYYVPGGTAAGVLASNPTNAANGSPFALVSFDTANPDSLKHFRTFGPDRGGTVGRAELSTGNSLHILDSLFSSDFDDYLLDIAFENR